MRYLKIFSILVFYILYFTQLNASLENKIVVKVGNKIITEFDIKNKILTSLILAEQNIFDNIRRTRSGSGSTKITTPRSTGRSTTIKSSGGSSNTRSTGRTATKKTKT